MMVANYLMTSIFISLHFGVSRERGGYEAISFLSTLQSPPPPKMAGVAQPFHFSPRWQWLRNHFIFLGDGRGCIAISFPP